MKPFLTAVLMICLVSLQPSFSQVPFDQRVAFLSDTSVFNATLVTNMKKIFSHSKHGDVSYGYLNTTLADGKKVDDQIMMNIRGHFRQGFCYVPPLKLTFNYKDSAALAFLKSLKLVSQCKISQENEQNLIKEYLIYKMYNLFTPMSFRNRLVSLTFQDSAGIKKPIVEHAFLLEDIADVARRNGCVESKNLKLNTEMTNRKQMTLVALFEYMIGNTDWAVSVNHNTRLISLQNDPHSRPFVVPYDFDYSGLVNTDYAVPDEKLEIENVTQRLYRGFARTMPELKEALDTFKLLKKNIYAIINNCSLLTSRSKDGMIKFLDEFYVTIESESTIRNLFIDAARKE